MSSSQHDSTSEEAKLIFNQLNPTKTELLYMMGRLMERCPDDIVHVVMATLNQRVRNAG